MNNNPKYIKILSTEEINFIYELFDKNNKTNYIYQNDLNIWILKVKDKNTFYFKSILDSHKIRFQEIVVHNDCKSSSIFNLDAFDIKIKIRKIIFKR